MSGRAVEDRSVGGARRFRDPGGDRRPSTSRSGVRRGPGRGAHRLATGTLAVVGALTLAAPAPAAPTAEELAASVAPLRAPVERLRVAPTIRPVAPPVQRGRTAVPADVLFAFDRAELRPQARRALVRLAATVAGRGGTLRVVGHADGRGDAAYNRRLSLRRARAVAAVLRSGLPARLRIRATGRGSADPVADETTPTGEDDPDGRARNRRVELRIGR